MASQTFTVKFMEQVINSNSLDACRSAGFDLFHSPVP
jgi:hypothetical protein